MSPIRLAIIGAVGSGRRHVCRILADKLNCEGIWTLDLSLASSYEDALKHVQHVRAMATLHHALIVVTAFPESQETPGTY